MGGHNVYFKDILQNIRLAAVIMDREGNIIFINDFLLQVTGWMPSEVMGKSWFDIFVPADDRARLQGLFGELLLHKIGATVHHVETIQTREGLLRHIGWNSIVVIDQEGMPTLTCIGDDITSRLQAEQELQASEERYRDLFENATDIIQCCGSDGHFIYVNQAWYDILGYDEEDFKKISFIDILHPEHKEHCIQAHALVMAGQNLNKISGAFITKDGRKIEVEGNVGSRFEAGQPVATRGIFRDVSERNKAYEALKESEERYRTLFEKTANPILVIDDQGRYIECNQAACDFLECNKEELLQKHVTDTSVPGDNNDLAMHQQLWEDGGTIETYYYVKGKLKVLELTITPANMLGKKVIFGMGKDITERKQVEEKIRYMAYYDPLTDVPNRVLFKEKLQQAIDNAKVAATSVAVMFMDLDRFKKVNDTFGHEMGDKVLQLVAERLRNGKFKGLIGRLGGDEFTLLFENIHLDELNDLAEKVLALFKAPLRLKGKDIYITPSIGVALYPQHGRDPEELLKHADAAMYHAKVMGCNRYQVYSPKVGSVTSFTIDMENSLHKALKRQQIEVFYQHQLDMSKNQIVGAEALVRWHHPEKGLVPPNEFIPMAEENGLIIPIGEFVLHHACQDAVAWHRLGHHLKIAVNLSVRQFFQKDLITMVKRVLAETQLDPKYLELEITETAAVQDMNYAKDMLLQLKDLGVNIAIDDFGVGYNSMSNFKSFPPIDTLKIDRTFVKDIAQQTDYVTKALVANMIHLGKTLKLNVVAEGVETEAQLKFLRKNHCDLYQGYYFSRPMPAANFIDSLTIKV